MRLKQSTDHLGRDIAPSIENPLEVDDPDSIGVDAEELELTPLADSPDDLVDDITAELVASIVISQRLRAAWREQNASLTDASLNQAIDMGEFDTSWESDWRADWTKMFDDDIGPHYEATATRASNRWQTIVAAAGIVALFATAASKITGWIRARSAELAAAMGTQQHNVFGDQLRFSRTGDLSKKRTRSLLRASIGLSSRDGGVLRRMHTELDVAGDLKAPQVDAAVGRRASSLRKHRAAVFALTEASFSYNFGGFLAMESGESEGAFDGGLVKVWYTQLDERVCPFCGPLHGKVIEMQQTFPANGVNQASGLAPPGHPRCRCTPLYMVA